MPNKTSDKPSWCSLMNSYENSKDHQNVNIKKIVNLTKAGPNVTIYKSSSKQINSLIIYERISERIAIQYRGRTNKNKHISLIKSA